MTKINNPLEVYKFLEKSNCKQCDLPTCLAFASAVIKGQKNLDECPHLDRKFIEQLAGKIVKPMSIEEQQELALESLKKEVTKIDFSTSADRLGAEYSEESIKIKCLGKNVFVDTKGNIKSDIHIISWVTIPLLNYIISCKGKSPSGKWVPFRELKNGKTREPLFVKGCEIPLKEIADKDTELLKDILLIFGGKSLENSFSSHFSLVLYPLPKIPVLFSYSKQVDERVSQLNIFFDALAEDNLDTESIHMLCTGLVTMFHKIFLRHS